MLSATRGFEWSRICMFFLRFFTSIVQSDSKVHLEPGVGVEPTFCGSAGHRLNRSAFGDHNT
jgi:hypothetical protein